MRVFQVVLTIVTLLFVLGMFGCNLWVGENFSEGLALPRCYTPLNSIAASLVLVTSITGLIRKKAAAGQTGGRQ